MIKLTDILSKPVVSLSGSKTEGIIKSAIFDKNFKRLKFLILFDNNELTTEKALNIKNIYSLGENAIIIKDELSLELELSCVKIDDKTLPINNFVYTYLGKYLGQVSDIVLDEKFYIDYIIAGDKKIEIKDIISSGLDALIVQDEHKKVKINSLKRRQKTVSIQNINTNNEKVYILEENTQVLPELNNIEHSEIVLDDNINNEEKVEKPEEEIKKPKVVYKLSETPFVPKTITSNYEFLLGRKLEKNIYSPTRELIAKKNTKITKETIQKAQMFYKVREVIKYSH